MDSSTSPEDDGGLAAWDVVVVGAGAAGLLAAIRSAERGWKTLLIEKNRKPGVKILMSGGGRCNLTQSTDARGIVSAFGPQGRFLHSALAALGPRDLVNLVEAEGVPTKVEETGKIFPVSNRALDVLNALRRRLERSGCTLALGESVLRADRYNDSFRLKTSLRTVAARYVILTTGGESYPGCGTTGDGYAWASGFGHTIVPRRPALVPLASDASWIPPLRGVTVPDVSVGILNLKLPSKGELSRTRGSFLFTHFGISGPAVLDVSRAVSSHANPRDLAAECDFLPDEPASEFDKFLKRESALHGKHTVSALVAGRLPRRLVDTFLELAVVPAERRGAELGKSERMRIVQTVKQLRIPLAGTLGFAKAEVTAGGVSLDEVDSRTMQSKRVPNLFIAGELLDLDGPIGGYNFQAAFSTAWLAGESVGGVKGGVRRAEDGGKKP